MRSTTNPACFGEVHYQPDPTRSHVGCIFDLRDYAGPGIVLGELIGCVISGPGRAHQERTA